MTMTSDEIRESYLAYFEERGHLRIPSASLVPSAHDPSALLTVAGMHPLKPYFLGEEAPPAPRLTSCQKSFRTVDIDKVGDTTRHLTFFEMLGNFSFGDYFKREAIAFAWELSREVWGLAGDDIWVTVFQGDSELGLGPDEEAIEIWLSLGVPRERIVECNRAENFWQAGPTGPSGPSSELYLDRGLQFGAAEDLPGGENERFLEYWNLVFTEYDLLPTAAGERQRLARLPARNIDTGLGLNRMAAILQGKSSVFETDQFWPLIELGQELSGRSYGEESSSDRALRILADHGRAMTFLIADGVVPSNEDRGYVLRRVMRRAIQQGRSLAMEPGFLTRYGEVVRELMAGAYPELTEQWTAIERWLASEEESFGRTLDQGSRLLEELIERAQAEGSTTISGSDAFTLHDTFGFPFEVTRELLAERGLAVEEESFAELMEAQRERARAAGAGSAQATGFREQARELAGETGAPTRFTGYETTHQLTTVGAVEPARDGADPDGPERYLVKLAESPFYAAGGGQVSDRGVIECEDGDCRAVVEDVLRVGEDQALEVSLERGALRPRERVRALVDDRLRHATEANHTATHLLQAALRERLGPHVRQAGSYVGPDKLRFDFTHGGALTAQELTDVEDRVNEWISRNEPVHALQTTFTEARRLGAMALFGEKYGDVVRMVEVGDGRHSRELCGGTHVRRTGEIGPFVITSETSSAANVRRIEALTGPEAVRVLREHDRSLADVAQTLRTPVAQAAAAVRERERERRSLEKELRSGSGARGPSGADIDALVADAQKIDGALLLARSVEAPDVQALLRTVDQLKGRLSPAAIVLGTALPGPDPRVHLVASISPELVSRGLRAGSIVKAAAAIVGGGGGGRDTLAQAGGRDPERLPEAIEAARAAIEAVLAH
jgi:alanyl-tRNA synthetase